MRVLQIIDGLGTGGAEKLIVETVPEFVKRGLKVDVLLLNGEQTLFYKELALSQSCRIFALGKSFYNPLYIFKIIPYLKNYDVVHVHLFPAQYFAVLAKVLSFSKVKFVFTEHSTGNRRIHNPKLRAIEQWVYKHYDHIIAITDQVKEVLISKLSLSSEKITTVSNGINIAKLQEEISLERESLGFSATDKIISVVAGFRPEKDQDTVIKSLAYLPLTYKIMLVGDGARRAELERLVTVLKLEDRVKFLGFRSDVYSLIKMANIAVLSSHWEGFGLAAAEAMACGIPTLASNVPGLADVVSGGGILFEKGNAKDLANKILSLEEEGYYAQIKNNCLAKAKQYDIHGMIDKIIAVYRKLCIK